MTASPYALGRDPEIAPVRNALPIPAARADDPQAGMIARLSEDELLDCLGPDWSRMPAKQRQQYATRPISLLDQLEAEIAEMDERLRAAGLEAERHLRALQQRKTPYVMGRDL